MSDDLLPAFPIKRGRVHEAQGPGALGFAAISAGMVGGTALWCQESWRSEQLNPQGLSGFADPGQMLLAKAHDQAELLAIAEESLRNGAVSLVIMELSKPLNLTAGRRLQLAAKTGRSTGLCLIAEGAGSSAAESRWHCQPAYDTPASDTPAFDTPAFDTPAFDTQDWTRNRWSLIKNKSGILGAWHVRWDWAARRLRVVSSVSE